MNSPADLSGLKSRWNEVLDHLEGHDRVAWISYFDARLAAFDGHVLTLDFSDARKFPGGHEYSPTRLKLENSLKSSIVTVLKINVEIEELA